MINRREFVACSAVAAAGMSLPLGWVENAFAAAPTYFNPNGLTPFMDALPVPPLKDGGAGNTHSISVAPLQHSYHSTLSAHTLWGYDGIYPGPTLLAHRNQVKTVTVTNNLPMSGGHPFEYAFDPTLGGDEPSANTIAVHLHGGETIATSDGNPMDTIEPSESKVYTYNNGQHGTTLWYHDHAMDNTRLNVMAGLAGFYLLIDSAEEARIVADKVNRGRGLPTLPYMFGLALQDRDFNADGSVYYPSANTSLPSTIPAALTGTGIGGADFAIPGGAGSHPVWMPEYFGNTICVNGKAMPFMNVEPRRYRFRILNGAQARFFNVFLKLAVGRLGIATPDALKVSVLGSDGGYLSVPVKQGALLFAPGERYDIVLDFTGVKLGTSIDMVNDAAGPFPSGHLWGDGGGVADHGVMPVMRFNVVTPLNKSVANLPLPLRLTVIKPAVVPPRTKVRSLFLNEEDFEPSFSGNPVNRVLLNNTGYVDRSVTPAQMIEASEVVRNGGTEVWEIANTTMDTHPIHLHLVQYRMLSRQSFRADAYHDLALKFGNPVRATGFLTNAPTMMGRLPRPQEAAWKDTLLMHPGEVTRILVKFCPQDVSAPVAGTNYFPFDPTIEPGYVWHCHILEHEECDMMRPLVVHH